MSQFVTIIIHDLTYVFLLLFPFFLVSDLGRIVSGGRDGRIPLVFMMLLLFVFLGLFGRLGFRDRNEGLGSLNILPAVYRFLCLNFMRGGVSGLTSLEDLYISFSHIETWS